LDIGSGNAPTAILIRRTSANPRKNGAQEYVAQTVLVNVEPQDEGDEDYSTSVFMTTLGRVPKGTKFGPHDVIYDSGAEAHVFRDDFF
jgi:hypothetical protein